MRGGGDSDEQGRQRSRNLQDSARRASASASVKSTEGDEEEGDEDEEDNHENNESPSETGGVVSTHKGNNSPRETIVLDASYPPPPEDFPDEEEEEEDEDDALEVVVETLLGDTFRVRVSQWDTAAGLKNLLFRTQGIPMSHQHLLLGQTELLDDACLIEQGVIDGSTLRLVLAMRGGPINARRLPTHQDLLRDITEYVDNELDGEKIWEGNGGRTVTLLVLRDGDNVNVYRVVENRDGSFSPLNESFSSMANSEQLERETIQAAEDGARTRARMKELQARMDAAKNKKRARKDKSKLSHSQRSVNRASKVVLECNEDVAVPAEVSESPGNKPGEPGSRPHSSNHRTTNSGRRVSRLGQRVGRNSRPTTQERSDMRRNSLSKASTILEVLPRTEHPLPVDFTRKKPLHDIPAKTERNRLSAVDEEHGKGRGSYHPPDALSKGMENKKKFESYRKSLVRHVMVPDTDSRADHLDKADNNEESRRRTTTWPRREVSVPLYMPPIGPIPRRNYEGDRLNRSHNQDLSRVARVNTNNRPKTSPEVLEHRPGSTGDHSTIRDRIHLHAPDERVREICTILSNSRGNSRQSHHSGDSSPDTVYPPSLSTSFSGSTGLPRTHRSNSVSVSLSSLKSHGVPPPSPGRGALVTSGSRKQRDMLRELMRTQGPSTSRRTTPENSRAQGRRPGSGRLHTSPPHLPPVTPTRRKARKKPRCDECSKRVKLGSTYNCRCGRIFCTQHRYPEAHECTYDFRTEGRRLIQMANPLVASHRLPKI